MSATFAYVVIDPSGRKLRGEVDAQDAEQAAEQLRQRGDTVVELTSTTESGRALRLESRIDLNDRQLADFAFDLRALIQSGAPLPKALATMASGTGHKKITSLARDLKLQLELGNAASTALATSKSAGVRLFGRFLAAAEQGGRYEMMLDIASDFLSRRARTSEQLRSAAAYPMFLLVVSIIAIGFLVIYVAPALAPMFEGAETPLFLAVTSSLGLWVQDNARLALLLLAATLGGLYYALKSGRAGRFAAALARRLPGARRTFSDLEFGPTLLAYSALLKSAWPAERGLRLTADISDGRARKTYQAIASSLRDGATLTEAFANSPDIPMEARRAIEIGEQTGSVPAALGRAGDHLVNRGIRSLDRLAAVLGPILIAMIGGLVALLMISLLSSLTSLGDAAL